MKNKCHFCGCTLGKDTTNGKRIKVTDLVEEVDDMMDEKGNKMRYFRPICHSCFYLAMDSREGLEFKGKRIFLRVG